MTPPSFDGLSVGDALPEVVKPPITRTTLALFAGASNDHNPIHIDIDVARKAGMDDVFAHGMLIMAYLGQVLTNWVPPSAIRLFETRFAAITHVGDIIHCAGEIIEKYSEGGENRVRIALKAVAEDGETKLVGAAVVALN